MILLFADNNTPRLQYIARFIFRDHFGVKYSITSDRNFFEQADAVKISYTTQEPTTEALQIPVASLLSQTNICQQSIEVFEINGLPTFFEGDKRKETFAFDIFSAIFYLLTRYEEYLPHAEDQYGRYDHQQSVAALNGFLKIPLVNKWLNFLLDFIMQRFPSFKTKEAAFTFTPTFDVDIAFEWRQRGPVVNSAHLLTLLLKKNYEGLSAGFRILANKQEDPFNRFGYLNKLNTQYQLTPLYFFLVARRRTRFDKNINPGNNEMRKLIRQHALKYQVGLHPSFYSFDDERLLKKEKFLLEEITGKVISKSRQHYLRFSLPKTYRQLEDAGILDEYSMGYGNVNGFRASYAGPFYWYDIEREQETNLRVHPFCYMDSNAVFHQKFSPAEALTELLALYEECRKVNGTFAAIFHNHLMGTNDLAWANVYQFLLEKNDEGI